MVLPICQSPRRRPLLRMLMNGLLLLQTAAVAGGGPGRIVGGEGGGWNRQACARLRIGHESLLFEGERRGGG